MIGFTLAKIVLGITAVSIGLFLIYLITMESMIGSDIREAYQQVLVPNRMAAEMLTTAAFEKFFDDLTNAAKDPSAQWTQEASRMRRI